MAVDLNVMLRCRFLVSFFERHRFPLSDEKRLQESMALLFAEEGIIATREVRLGDAGIIDFIAADIGVEVKIKGSKREIFRQCERYCGHEEIGGLVLATNVAMGLPAEINGKPILIARLGKAWL